MFMFYRLHVISLGRGYGHVHALYESTFAVTFDGRLRRLIAFFPTSSIRSIGLCLTCWMGSHEELFRLRPESLHLG
jgi:hypothetical protein